MTPERYRQVGQICHAALELEPARRAAFLDEVCAGDNWLRWEVESLLALQGPAEDFIETPAAEILANALAEGPTELRPGRHVGHYQILSPLGAGGMGKVYLALDTRLGRKVALKLLPPGLARNHEWLRRFRQEARAAAALNHQNIVHIYAVGEAGRIHFIAMEYVDGQTLENRISGHPLDTLEVVEVGLQVAEALEEAHSKGIAHRDIKPANIMLTPRGQAKVLDFGLAKVTAGERLSVGGGVTGLVSTSPGLLMGTARYMSPEQALRSEVDHRTDIFSFGVVLYEMVTGSLPFRGDTTAAVFDAILNHAPAPVSSLNPGLPVELERLISRALEKDCRARYQTAAAMKAELKWLAGKLVSASAAAVTDTCATAPTAPALAPRRLRSRLGWPAAFIVTVMIVGAAVSFITPPPATKTPPSALRAVPFTSFVGQEGYPAFSPDGNRIAFVWGGENRGGNKVDNADIYVKPIGVGRLLRLTTDPARELDPAWSPDGRYIAFVRVHQDGSADVNLVTSSGNSERKLADIAEPARGGGEYGRGIAWTSDGKFLAVSDKSSQGQPRSIFLLSIETGGWQRLTSPPSPSLGDSDPAFSPDGQTLAFVRTSGTNAEDIYLMPTAGGEARRLTFDNSLVSGVAWTADGRELVFSSRRAGFSSSLWRVAATGGSPERVATFGLEDDYPSISRQGDRLAYTHSYKDSDIWRVEVPNPPGPAGPPSRLISSTEYESSPQYSPDGNKIAFASRGLGNAEIWVCDQDGANPTQLTNMGGPVTGTPRWSPDGRQIVFDSYPGGNPDIFVISAEGGRPRRLTDETSEDIVPSWSRDGRWIYFGSDRSGELQIWKVPAEGGRARQVTSRGGFEAFESPDGKHIYYAKGRNIPGIWRVPVAGGEERPILNLFDAGYLRYWAVVESGIYFATKETTPRPTIQLFSFATGKVTEIAQFERTPAIGLSGLSASPDGRWILYVQRDQIGGDIMVVENFR